MPSKNPAGTLTSFLGGAHTCPDVSALNPSASASSRSSSSSKLFTSSSLKNSVSIGNYLSRRDVWHGDAFVVFGRFGLIPKSVRIVRVHKVALRLSRSLSPQACSHRTCEKRSPPCRSFAERTRAELLGR